MESKVSGEMMNVAQLLPSLIPRHTSLMEYVEYFPFLPVGTAILISREDISTHALLVRVL